MNQAPSIARIKASVAAEYGISLVDLDTHRRFKDFVEPRHVAMYLAASLTRHSFPAIARHFAGRDHTTAAGSWPGMSCEASSLICRRLDAGIAKAAALGAEVRAIYLTEADRALLTRWWSHRWRRKLGSSAIFHPCAYRDHPVRPGKRTIIYTDHGVGVGVPRHV